MSQAILFDAIVIVAYFALVIGIGLWMSRGAKSVEGFALGNREIAWWAVLASILASEISAGTFFGTPGEGFAKRNYTYFQLIVGYLLARLVVSAIFIPAYYRHNVVSIYEFLETRFGPQTRRLSSGVFLITRLLASGTRLWVPTLLFVMIWQAAYPGSALTAQDEFLICGGALVFITLATSVYTTFGGIRAVIWTDVLQILVLFAALGFSFFYLISHVGGWDAAAPHLNQVVFVSGTKEEAGFWANVKLVLEQEYTIWAAFIGSTFVTLATHGTDQDMVQRMLTAKNKRQSAVATILSGVVDIPIVLCVLAIGILLSVYYGMYPDASLPRDPATGQAIANKVFPHFILHSMPGGLRGLVIAGVLATAMGSLSTAINSLATSYVRDFHFRWFGEPPDEAGKLRTFRLGTVLFSLLFIGVGLGTAWITSMKPDLRIIPIILGIFGYTYGSLLGIFLVGLFTRSRGSEKGNIIAMVAGFLVVMYLSGLDKDIAKLFGGSGLPRPGWVPEVKFVWRIFFGTITTFLVAFCFRTPREKIESYKSAGEPAK
jgi:solute:Na+ symporter, SSS family